MLKKATLENLLTLDQNDLVELCGQRKNPKTVYVTANDIEYFPGGTMKVSEVLEAIKHLKKSEAKYRRPGIIWYVTK